MEQDLKEFWENGYMILYGAIPVSTIEGIMKEVGRLTFYLIFEEVYGGDDYDMGWETKHWVALKSFSEGVEQEPHHDFPSFATGRVHAKYQTIQAGAMVWPMPNTKLIAYDFCFTEVDARKRLALEFSAGDCIIFLGDLVHAGTSFDAMNYRIHCTLTVKGIKWRRGATETALFKQIKCAYCPLMAQMKLKVRNHT